MVLSGPPPLPATTRTSSTTGSSCSGILLAALVRGEQQLLECPRFGIPRFIRQPQARLALARGQPGCKPLAHCPGKVLRGPGQIEAVGPRTVGRQVTHDDGLACG